MSESEETQSSVPSTSDNSVENQPQASPSDPLNKRTEEEIAQYVAEEEEDERRWDSRISRVKKIEEELMKKEDTNINDNTVLDQMPKTVPNTDWFFKKDDEWSFQNDHEDN